jgi:hypothetical protein
MSSLTTAKEQASDRDSVKPNPSKKIELDLDFRESDLETFYKLRRALSVTRNLKLNIFHGAASTSGDQVLNWFWLLNSRPKKCRITTHLHCNLKSGGLVIAVLSDKIIPRIGSWYSVQSLDAYEKEMMEGEIREPTDIEKSSCANLKLVHHLLGQFIDLKEALDTHVPIVRLKELGLPLEEINRSKFFRQVELFH